MLREELTLKTINTDPLHFHPRRVEIYLNSILPPFPLFSPWWPCMPVSALSNSGNRQGRGGGLTVRRVDGKFSLGFVKEGMSLRVD